MTRPDPRPVFLDEHGLYVFADGTRVPDQPVGIRKALVGGFVTLALIVMIPLLAGFAAYRDIVNDQIDHNEAIARKLNAERIERTRAINEFLYARCLEDEVRDVVIVAQLNGALTRVRATLPEGNTVRIQQEEVLLSGIVALEPENEPDCRPPAAVIP